MYIIPALRVRPAAAGRHPARDGRHPKWKTTDRLNSSSRLLILLLAAGAIGFVTTLLLPDSVAPAWVRLAQPVLLLVAAGMALINARSYRSDLRAAFVLLAVFLLLYGLLNIESLNDRAFAWLELHYFRWLFVYQLVDYAFLLGACFFILRSIVFSRMSSFMWVTAVLTALLGVVIVWTALPTYDELVPLNRDAANIYLFIRVLDAIVAVALVPVVALYLQSARRERRESASFATVLAGVVVGLSFVYVYELVSGDSLLEIAAEQAVTGSLLDAFYVAGYWTIVAGLVAHWLNHRLAFVDLDRVLEPAT